MKAGSSGLSLLAYLQGGVDRPPISDLLRAINRSRRCFKHPVIENSQTQAAIIDLTEIGPEARFSKLTGWRIR